MFLFSLAMLLALFGGGFSGIVQRVYAQSAPNTAACGVEDTDNVEEEIQAENEADDATEPQCAEDDDAVQEPAYAGSIALDDSVAYGSEDAESAALASRATITAEEAQAAVEAETGGTVVKVELDNENGVLVYSVELEDGTDVKVDAGNGSILIVEPAGEAGEEAE
jgi:uncharacterized membrane protein YkoI